MKRNDIVNTIKSLEGETGHKRVLEIYNSQSSLPRGYKVKMTDAWCATTVSAVFLINGGCPFAECSCPRMVEKAKSLGIWVENDNYKPQPGDVIMYDWQDSGKGDNTGTPDHVGIVIAVNGSDLTIREGNKNKTIANRYLKVGGKYIRGYITPKYDETQTTAPKTQTPKTQSTVTISLPTLKKGSKGKAVKVWQAIIGASIDGIFGSNTEALTRTFQSSKGLEVDGIVGTQSWSAGLKSL